MKKQNPNYIAGRMNSFGYAFRGVSTLFKEESNAKIHALLAVVAIAMGFWLHISAMEWIAVAIVIGLVFAMEAMNTAIEDLADYACNNEIHPSIKRVKDLAAAAVLFSAIGALATGLIIFLPKLLQLL